MDESDMDERTTRRQWLLAAVGAFGLMGLPASWRALAAELLRTPAQTEGPFYPLSRPAGLDNDLVHIAGRSGIAAGELTVVGGKVVDTTGRPLSGVLVEIWQANAHGRYQDSRDHSAQPLDPNYKGYGTCLTDAEGAYTFQTIKPVPYPGRAPHIHFALTSPVLPRLVTQMYVDGAKENGRDFVLRSLDAAERKRVIVALEKATADSWRAKFDIVVDRRA
ncbi:MAG: protocatechuate 3,4-dioxygenase [Betaproteobacteria bacterium]